MPDKSLMKQNTMIDGAVVTSIAGFSLTHIDAWLTTVGLALAVAIGLSRFFLNIREIWRGRKKKL